MIFEKYRFITQPPTKWAELVINEEKCTGCARCVKQCPIQLLELNNNKKVRYNERYSTFQCITCENCRTVCKEKAITIEKDYRVLQGFWKNDHLFSGGKIPPAPLGQSNGEKFDDYKDRLTETERVIYKRRSNRLYKKKQVEPELINRIIEAGRFAPSAGNNQPWKFIVVQNPAMLDELNQKTKTTLRFFSKLIVPHPWIDKKTPGDKNADLKKWQKILLWILVWFFGGEADQRVPGGLNAVTSDKSFHSFFKAPTMILILADKRAIGGIKLDLGICAQTMVLAAHSLGLGTCYVDLLTRTIEYNRKLRKKLGITHPFKIITALAVGYPQGKIDGIVSRERPRVKWIA